MGHWPSGAVAQWPLAHWAQRAHGPLARWPSAPLAQWPDGPVGRWPSGPAAAVQRATGPMARWAAGPVDQWPNGPLTQWAIGPLGHTAIEAMEPVGDWAIWPVGHFVHFIVLLYVQSGQLATLLVKNTAFLCPGREIPGLPMIHMKPLQPGQMAGKTVPGQFLTSKF